MSERQLTPNDPTLKKTALAADRIIGQLIPRNRSIDAEEFQKSVEYEKLTQEIYQGLLSKEPGGGTVEHNQNVRGRSGVEHQIDVLWRFKKAGVDHLVCVVECKNYLSNITLEKVRSLFGVLHDIGNCQGIMVTKTGFQSGAAAFAKFYGIDLKLVRKPIKQDFEGAIKTVHITQVTRTVDPKTIRVGFQSADPASSKFRNKEGVLLIPPNPETYPFYDQSKTPKNISIAQWIQDRIHENAEKKLKVLQLPTGSHHQLKVPVEDHYILFDVGTSTEQLVKIDCVEISYAVIEAGRTEMTLEAEEIVESILKDYSTGDLQHVKHVDGFKWEVSDPDSKPV